MKIFMLSHVRPRSIARLRARWSARGHARGAAVRSQVKSSQVTLGMLHAGVDQKRLKCNIFKTLFRSVRLGRVEADASARSAETTATSDVAET